MTEEEHNEMMRSNWKAQMAALGYGPGGLALPQKKTSGWISVKDRLPAETHSIFFRFYGTNKWNKSMWREQSDKVLVTVAFKDGTKIVTTGETHDGIWNTTISRTLEPVVTHWAEMPEPPKEGEVG